LVILLSKRRQNSGRNKAIGIALELLEL